MAPGYFEYYAETGDTLRTISKKFSVDERELAAINGGTAVLHGRKLKIPWRRGGCRCGAFYSIRREDTLKRIADRCGITVGELLSANPFLNPSYFLPGQVIVLPCASQRIAHYTLGSGERLSDVLMKYDMDLTLFCALNPQVAPMSIKAGRRVNVRKKEKTGRRYTLKDGDNIVTVAEMFGVTAGELMGANKGIKPGGYIPGVTVRIPSQSGVD